MNQREEWRDFAAQITMEAAERAKALYAQGTTVHEKADGSVVTDIDREVERFLRQRIADAYPDHAVLGEEYGSVGAGDAPLWALDPVDGTTNLANGLPHWGVSVGLVVGGEPVIGALAFPLLEEFYVGALELGATRNGVPLTPLPLGGPTHWEDTYAICSTSVREINFDAIPARLRVFGSAALELCWTATGQVRGCQSIGVSLYDIAAGVCIAREVGAEIQWLSGEVWNAGEMRQNGGRARDVLITAPAQTLAFLRERVRYRDENP